MVFGKRAVICLLLRSCEILAGLLKFGCKNFDWISSCDSYFCFCLVIEVLVCKSLITLREV